MLKKIILLFSILFLINSLPAGENCWTSLGPSSFNVRDIVIDPKNPNIIYVACFNSGLYKSRNRGKTWVRKWDNVMNCGGYDIELDPNNSNIIYFGTYEGIFKSIDGG